ncbi:MAG: signal peptidase type [Symbiobacteriaceae bacterium]|nr:signal peptidase type [Symbiobacteriaceae bacterium]
MKTMLKILNGAITVFLILVIALFGGLAFSARKSGDAIPTIMGHKVLTVLSGSMEPAIHTGDVIIVKPLRNPAAEVKDGDIITFRTQEKADMLITHRVSGTILVNNQPVAFTTKGDANESPDLGVLNPNQIVGKYQWRVPYFGYFASFMRQPVGIITMVILPGLIIIGLEFRKMWQTLSEAEKAKEEAAKTEPGGEEEAN